MSRTLNIALTLLVLVTLSNVSVAQWAETGVDVGPGHAGATGGADGQWTFVDTTSRVNGAGSLGHGVAIGAGPGGISFSHSLGVNGGGVGAAHNMNMSIGLDGAHVSGGHVVSQGGDSRVVAGGGSGRYPGGFGGGSTVTGYGNVTQGQTYSHTERFSNFLFGP